jgi:hypothetical protein
MRLAARPVGVGKTRGILATGAVTGRQCTELAKWHHAVTREAPN